MIWTLICHYQISMYQEPEPSVLSISDDSILNIEQSNENIQEIVKNETNQEPIIQQQEIIQKETNLNEKLAQEKQTIKVENIPKQPITKPTLSPKVQKPKQAKKKPKKNISQIVTSFVLSKIKFSNLKIKEFKNFKTDWNDGVLMTNFIQYYIRDIEIISRDKEYTKEERIKILDNALDEIEKRKNIDKIIDAVEIISDNIDDKALLTYISSFMSLKEEIVKAKIEFNKDEIHIGDIIEGIVNVSVPLGSNDKITVNVTDDDGNVIEYNTFKNENKKYIAKISVENSFKAEVLLNGTIINGSLQICEALEEIININYETSITFIPTTIIKGKIF